MKTKRVKGTANHPDVGKRVEIPAYADMWMRGARYGTIERVRRNAAGFTLYGVRLDRANATLHEYIVEECQLLENREIA